MQIARQLKTGCDMQRHTVYMKIEYFNDNGTILQRNETFGQELVVLQTPPSRFSKFSVVWRFKQKTFYISSLRVKLILACQELLK